MAALNFPDTPAVGELYGSAGTVWRWDGARWASTAGASGARGAVAYAQVTANQGSITTAWVDIAGLSVTWVADPSRTYRVSVQVQEQSTVAGDPMHIGIYSGSTRAIRASINANSLSSAESNYAAAILKGLSGSVTYKAMATCGGTGTLTVAASPDIPSWILVEDITYEAGSGGPSITPSAWTLMTPLTNGWTTIAGLPPAWRMVGDSVELRGGVTGGTLSTPIFSMPTLAPPQQRYFTVTGNGPNPSQVTVGTNGNITPLVNTGNVILDQVSWSVTP